MTIIPVPKTFAFIDTVAKKLANQHHGDVATNEDIQNWRTTVLDVIKAMDQHDRPTGLIPTTDGWIRLVGETACLAAGDSWISDDGAQDQWSATVHDVIVVMNTELERDLVPA